LFDVYFGPRIDADGTHGPSKESLSLVARLRGNVVHTYHLPMARVIMDVDSVAGLSANFVDGVQSAVRTVGAQVTVHFEASGVKSGDVAYLAWIGAKDFRYHSDFVSCWIPDESIPWLREHRTFTRVDVDSVVCTNSSK